MRTIEKAWKGMSLAKLSAWATSRLVVYGVKSMANIFIVGVSGPARKCNFSSRSTILHTQIVPTPTIGRFSFYSPNVAGVRGCGGSASLPPWVLLAGSNKQGVDEVNGFWLPIKARECFVDTLNVEIQAYVHPHHCKTQAYGCALTIVKTPPDTPCWQALPST